MVTPLTTFIVELQSNECGFFSRLGELSPKVSDKVRLCLSEASLTVSANPVTNLVRSYVLVTLYP